MGTKSDDYDDLDPSVSYSTGTITATLPPLAPAKGKRKRRKKLMRRPIGFMADIDKLIPVED